VGVGWWGGGCGGGGGGGGGGGRRGGGGGGVRFARFCIAVFPPFFFFFVSSAMGALSSFSDSLPYWRMGYREGELRDSDGEVIERVMGGCFLSLVPDGRLIPLPLPSSAFLSCVSSAF